MKAEDKAKELVDEMFIAKDCIGTSWGTQGLKEAKQCALICVDEIIKMMLKCDENNQSYYYIGEQKYWQEVKQQIENQLNK